MNTIERTWLTLKHRRKFARLGKRCQFPIPQLFIQGHVEMGDRCRFRNDVSLITYGDGKIIFGNRSGLSWGCSAVARELIQIGNYTAIAEFSYITDSMPRLGRGGNGGEDGPGGGGDDGPDGDGGDWITKPVIIGNDVFVGSGCIIGPGVTIGDGAVIGPFTTVTRDVGPLEIWTGHPARKMGHRTAGISEAQLQAFRDLVDKQGLQDDRYQ